MEPKLEFVLRLTGLADDLSLLPATLRRRPGAPAALKLFEGPLIIGLSGVFGICLPRVLGF